MSMLKTLVLSGALVVTPAVVHARAADPTAEQQSKPRAEPAPLPAEQAASYAARERGAQELEKFTGGASLSITLGTTALIVVAVLIALLIIF
jgi:hypothetical protein